MASSVIDDWTRAHDPNSVSQPHRGSTLVCGDSRSLVRTLPSNSVSCVITSPPYGDQKDYGTPGELGSSSHDVFAAELRELFGELHRACKEGAALWLVLDSIKRNGSDLPLPWEMASVAIATGWRLQDAVVWDKGKSLPWSHKGHFRSVAEHVLLLSKGPLKHFDLDAARESDHLSSYWVKYPERYHPAGKAPADIWHFPIPVQGSWSTGSVRHLCPFPMGLVGRMLALTTVVGDVVLDPFAGSGSVVVAAAYMRRRGIGIELSTDYFRAFKSVGAERLLTAAKRELRSASKSRRDSLSETIMHLRALKSARSLFGQLARHDRLGASARESILGFVVVSDIAKVNAGRNVRIVAVLRRGADRASIVRIATQLLSREPLSKFGLTFSFSAGSATGNHVKTVLRTSELWYEYHAGRFNSYRARLSTPEILGAFAEIHDARRARTPTIFSNIGLRVEAPQ